MTAELVVAILVCLGSALVVLVNGGRQVGRIEAAIGRLAGIEAKLEKVPVLEVEIGMVREAYERFRSDHKALAGTVDRIRDRLSSNREE